MFLNPIIATIHNTATNRWHPVLFVESPLPGSATLVRHKSKGHHTDGFDTKIESDEYATNHMTSSIQGVHLTLDTVFSWDGNGVPALVHFFEQSIA
jgi:hypothetical protein